MSSNKKQFYKTLKTFIKLNKNQLDAPALYGFGEHIINTIKYNTIQMRASA
jgi:hypothetical protein